MNQSWMGHPYNCPCFHCAAYRQHHRSDCSCNTCFERDVLRSDDELDTLLPIEVIG